MHRLCHGPWITIFGETTVNNNTTKMSAGRRRVTRNVIQSDASWCIRAGGVKASSGHLKSVFFCLSPSLQLDYLLILTLYFIWHSNKDCWHRELYEMRLTQACNKNDFAMFGVYVCFSPSGLFFSIARPPFFCRCLW